jgi:hypothetical protein
MAKFKGTIRKSDLEGGHWTLEADDGERYQLQGSTAALKDGARATVSGKVERSMMGIGMTGPILSVEKIDVE